ETTSFDVVSCLWIDHDPWTRVRRGVNRFEGTVEIADGVLLHRFGDTRGMVDGLPVFDVVHNFFLARRDRLRRDPWDERLKIGSEHTEFFLRLRERGLRCTRLPDVAVYHYPQLPPEYQAIREDRQQYWDVWRETRGFERREFRGRQFRKR